MVFLRISLFCLMDSYYLSMGYYKPLNLGSWHDTVRLDAAYTASYGPQLPAQSTDNFTT